MANCDGCGRKFGVLDSANDYNDKLFCLRCFMNIDIENPEGDVEGKFEQQNVEVYQTLEQQKDSAGSFGAIAFLGKMIFILGGLVAILVFITAVADGEAILIVPAIATLVSSLVFGALLVALGFIGLELNAIRNSLNSSLKSSSDTK